MIELTRVLRELAAEGHKIDEAMWRCLALT